MNCKSLIQAFLLALLLAAQNTDAHILARRKMEKSDLTFLLDQQLDAIFNFFAEKIIKSNRNVVGKRIFLKELGRKLIQVRQRVIEANVESNHGKSFMHWRMG